MNFHGFKKNRGSTLYEVVAVLVILSMIAAAEIPKALQKSQKVIVKRAEVEAEAVLNGAQLYRAATGVWPVNMAALIGGGGGGGGGYVNAAYVNTLWGGAYTFSTPGARFRISFDADELRFAGPVSGKLPFGGRSGTIVSAEVQQPGNEASNQLLYALDGSNGALTGDMDVGGNSISNASSISATTFNATDVNTTNVGTTNLTATQIDVPNLEITQAATLGGVCNPSSDGHFAYSGNLVLGCVNLEWSELGAESGPIAAVFITVSGWNHDTRDIGYYDHCSKAGVRQNRGGHRINSHVLPTGTRRADGTWLWRIHRRHEYTSTIDYVNCTTFS